MTGWRPQPPSSSASPGPQTGSASAASLPCQWPLRQTCGQYCLPYHHHSSKKLRTGHILAFSELGPTQNGLNRCIYVNDIYLSISMYISSVYIILYYILRMETRRDATAPAMNVAYTGLCQSQCKGARHTDHTQVMLRHVLREDSRTAAGGGCERSHL